MPGKDRVALEPSWKNCLAGEFDQAYMQELRQFLFREKSGGKVIYPPGALFFNALNLTPFEQVKVVILGQDPYHGPNQAHGLCFSVLPGVAFPPSLRNIFKEIQQEMNLPMPRHGCLTHWAQQGVLLLNAVLSVEQGKANSHQGKGWERFTDRIVDCLNLQRQHLVFLLWGSYAQQKARLVDTQRHLVLKSAHPSPLSASRGFLGNGHFSKTNEYLIRHGKAPIDWSVPDLPAPESALHTSTAL